MPDVEVDEAAWEAAAQQHEEAATLLAEGRAEEAEPIAKAAIAKLAETIGDEHPDYANALDTLAAIADALGRPREAIELARRAVKIFDLYPDEEVVQPMRAAALGHLAYRLAQSSDYAEAEKLARAALEIEETPVTWSNLGVVLRFAGHYEKAHDAYSKARRMYEEAKEPIPPALFHNLAGLACARDDFAASEAFARQAIAARANEPEDRFGLGTDLCGLGDALVGQGRTKEAIAAYREGIACYEAVDREEHAEMAFALHNLGDALAADEQTKEAEATYGRSLALKEKLYGREHHEIAATLSNLAALYADTNRLADARKHARRAVKIVKDRLPKGHPIRKGVESLAKDLG